MSTLTQHYEQIEKRATALLLTEHELIGKMDPPMAYSTYWRAKLGHTGTKGQIKVVRRVLATLDKLEAEAKDEK